MIALKRISPPQTEPVLLADAKAWLRIDTGFTADDALIQSLITAARERVEEFTGRSLVSQQWTFCLDNFPTFLSQTGPSRGTNYFSTQSYTYGLQSIQIPRSPVLSIDLITYVDPSLTVQTLTPAQFQVDLISEPARIAPPFNSFYPVTALVPNAVTINFTAGYTTCPESLKVAIKLILTTWYSYNSDAYLGGGTVSQIPLAAQRLMMPYRINPFDYSTR